jgi:hypothetical protein
MASRRLLLAVPVLAVVIVGVFMYVSLSDPSPAVNFRTMLIINVQLKNLNSSRIFPKPNIGLPGGIMSTTKYLSDGVGGRYPLYTVDASGVIYVRSTVTRDYTLGDFFQVWGEPLGTNNTLNLPYHNGTDTCGATHCFPYYWTMCLQAPSSTIYVPNEEWGNHVLTSQEIIFLAYSQIGCA